MYKSFGGKSKTSLPASDAPGRSASKILARFQLAVLEPQTGVSIVQRGRSC